MPAEQGLFDQYNTTGNNATSPAAGNNATSSAAKYRDFGLFEYIMLSLAAAGLLALVVLIVVQVRKSRRCCATNGIEESLLATPAGEPAAGAKAMNCHRAADSRPDEGAKASAAVSTLDSIFAFTNV